MSKTTTLVVCLLAATTSFAANIVTDGTFEAGGAAWTFTGATSLSNTNCNNASSFCAQIQGSNFGNFSQYINTIPGATYTVTFWFRNLGSTLAGPDNSFHFQWDNIIPLATEVINAGGSFATTFSVDMIAASNQTWLSFQGFNNSGSFRVDDISVDGPVAGTPEPATWALSAAAFATMVLLRRQKA